jgi:hypothetical protein
VGWSLRDDLRAEPVGDAVAMAIAARRPEGGLVHHSDRGSQYVSLAFGQRCREAGIDLSMTQGGDLRVDRGLLQPPETPHDTEQCESPGVRGSIYKSARGSGLMPNRSVSTETGQVHWKRLREEWEVLGRLTCGKVCPPKAIRQSGLLALNTLQARVHKRWKEQGLRPIGLHESRHTTATWLDHAGVSPKVVSDDPAPALTLAGR